ncbi:AP-3 complex subunit sigma-2 isoform X2 [Mustela putorius furo]|uniref:AP-3 complex subunit sigma-2 isoform X2 n=1 Tax=Mustela putorius furo TaxID=9669 RepID=A0A8U0RIE6_MUSPF|nr:AP-3 complex subunit sigma-2 isoform X2 [Mustela putorius furo]
MIQAILVFNNHGKPRLVRFYQRFPEEIQQQIVRETFHLVLKRDDNICNFLEGGSLIGGSDYKLIYRHYATLYFVFCVDSSESELGILDLIQTGRDTIDFCLSTCTNQRNSHHHQRHSKKVADCELGGEPSSEPVLPDLDLGLLASNTKKINFCCLSHTACAILLCQLKAANTLILISLTLSSKNNPLAQ